MVDKLRGHMVWLAFDPDALEQAESAARELGGARVVDLPMKIDDALNGNYINSAALRHLIKMARKVC